jgi:DNA-binding PadR family transcriptional regulator
VESQLLKGHLDLLLLATIRRRPAHGYSIVQALRERGGGELDLPEGTIYPALHRLERSGLLTGEWFEVTGRRRRVYTLSVAGKAELARRRGVWRLFVQTVDIVAGR